MFVWVSRMVTWAAPRVVSRRAWMKILLETPSSVARTLPSSTYFRASTSSSLVAPSSALSPFSGSPATKPSAAAWALPNASELGMAQVSAFLYMPLFIATSR